MQRLLLALTILVSTLALKAQETPLRFNVHVNPQFSWFNSNETDVMPDGSVFNTHIGVEMDYYFQKNYAFTFGLGINNLGGKLHYADSVIFNPDDNVLILEPGHTVKHKLQYLDIPLGLKFKTEEMGYATFFFQIGLNPMVKITAEATSDDETLYKDDINKSTNIFNMAYHAGIGLEYRLGGNTAFIGGIRWTSGLTDVTEKSVDNANIKINTLSIQLGVLF